MIILVLFIVGLGFIDERPGWLFRDEKPKK
jgi:hypothetical protein